ncbi:hypothetical protein H696_03571 [Fonticula alba]|uniref:Uncharacterized protein n=1 Tax=Fonticula alba TaxID=691883 RepID=A0A058Z747_FONAL|nr:hypothetical protein H696_03571 [Fonticula alba]KCV70109.1 hypothetical protein H696_03571 [Fonticula alba]|eukprot:XP_009495715.1 hypothetical protein H696_03571 [Fonticula alba]
MSDTFNPSSIREALKLRNEIQCDPFLYAMKSAELSLSSSSKSNQDKHARHSYELVDALLRVRDLEISLEAVREESRLQLAENEKLKNDYHDINMALSKTRAQINMLTEDLTSERLENQRRVTREQLFEKSHRELSQKWLAACNELAAVRSASTNYVSEEERRAFKTDGAISEPKPPLMSLQLLDTELSRALSTVPTHYSKSVPAHRHEINCIQFSHNGHRFATGSTDNTVSLFTESASPVRVMQSSRSFITDVNFSKDDEFVIASSTDMIARIWRADTGRIFHQLTRHSGTVCAAKFSMDSQRAVTASADRSIRVWDMQTGYSQVVILAYSMVNDVVLMDDSATTLLSAQSDHSFSFWDTRSHRHVNTILNVHTQNISGLYISPDYQYVLSASRDNTLKLIDVRKLASVATFKAPDYRSTSSYTRPILSPDGSKAAAPSASGKVFVWDVLNSNEPCNILSMPDSSDPLFSNGWSPLGSQIIAGSKSGRLHIWHA